MSLLKKKFYEFKQERDSSFAIFSSFNLQFPKSADAQSAARMQQVTMISQEVMDSLRPNNPPVPANQEVPPPPPPLHLIQVC